MDQDPNQPATAAELWPAGDYPWVVAEMLKALRRCDAAGGYIEMAEPESANLSIASHDGDEPTVNVALSGSSRWYFYLPLVLNSDQYTAIQSEMSSGGEVR